jgi:putative transposase
VDYRRKLIPRGTFFFTVTSQNGRSRWLAEHVEFVPGLIVRLAKPPFRSGAMVILPDPLHVIGPCRTAMWTIQDVGERLNPNLWEDWKAGRKVEERPDGSALVWRRRDWKHPIRHKEDFNRHVDYIHFKPVKHGLTPAASDWLYSLFHRYVRLGVLLQDWGRQ